MYWRIGSVARVTRLFGPLQISSTNTILGACGSVFFGSGSSCDVREVASLRYAFFGERNHSQCHSQRGRVLASVDQRAWARGLHRAMVGNYLKTPITREIIRVKEDP